MSARPGVAQASHAAARPQINTSWMDRSICRDTSIDFTSDKPWAIAEAIAVCHCCPVEQDCLEYALARREPEGVWGGLDPDQRAALLLQRHRPSSISKKSVAVTCRKCGETFEAANRPWYCPPCRVKADRARHARYDATRVRP